ncbi:MAG TPA: shikimate kinase [Jatrophihabitans sp.]|nr:shikimate kinase [Jatrophihabitans sp.]
MTPKAVLVGLPGTGKSSTGRRLAKILAVPFADSDELVEATAGRTVAEIFAERGEPAFRAAEQAAVVGALAGFDGVLALGGGAVGTAAVRDALAASGVPVVHLTATLATLADRIGDADHRPLLAGDAAARRATLAALAAERAPLYAAVATLAVATDGRTPVQVAATVAARLHELEVSR